MRFGAIFDLVPIGNRSLGVFLKQAEDPRRMGLIQGARFYQERAVSFLHAFCHDGLLVLLLPAKREEKYFASCRLLQEDERMTSWGL